MNANELLEKAYMTMFDNAMKNFYRERTMESGLKYMIFEGNPEIGDTYKWLVRFNKSIDFGYGNWNEFYFNSDIGLGKFLWNCKVNNGLPKRCNKDF